jgi:hypothetical protein
MLDRAPHTVSVQLMANVQGVRGSYEAQKVGVPLVVRCSVQAVREWSSEEEIQVDGLQALTLARIFSRTWPGDINSIVTWDGYEWETIGDPQHFQMSKRTNHWTITLRQRGVS